MAERRNRERFVTEQPPYSIFARGIERDVLPVTEKYGMGVLPVEPARRRLAGRHLRDRQADDEPRARRASPPATT